MRNHYAIESSPSRSRRDVLLVLAGLALVGCSSSASRPSSGGAGGSGGTGGKDSSSGGGSGLSSGGRGGTATQGSGRMGAGGIASGGGAGRGAGGDVTGGGAGRAAAGGTGGVAGAAGVVAGAGGVTGAGGMTTGAGGTAGKSGTGGVAGLGGSSGVGGGGGATGPQSYTSTWTSVDQHPAAAEWLQDAKFGLWTHWGAFSVPAFYSEWYAGYMFDKNGNSGGCYKHHVATFGDPFTTFGYDKFLTGGTDLKGNPVKFEPKLVTDGGKWDPDAWAQLFVDAGAKVAAPVGIHHDGFAMWDSKCTEWNSVSKGPKLDLVGLLAKAYRAHGMKLMVSSHDAYNFLGYYQYVPAQTDRSLKTLYGQDGKPAGEALWLCELKELIDGCQPDHMWHDGSVGDISDATVLSYLSYYYNKGVEWGRDVVVSNAGNDLAGHPGEVRQYERSGNGSLSSTFWISEESVSLNTWGYVDGMPYFSAKSLLDALIDRVSMNGFFLLNISPMADGTIPQAQKDLLLTMGAWLKVFGESIYSTRPWTKCCEGPTTIGGNFGSGPAEGTATDIRFNRSKDNKSLYAIALGWPANNQMIITSLKSASVDVSSIKNVTFLGDGSTCTYTQDSSGLKITLPSGQNYPNGYAVKLTFSGTVPPAK